MAEVRTARLLLRPWAAGDEDSLVLHANNWKVARNLRDVFPHPYTRGDAAAWIARNAAVDGPTLDFAVVFGKELVGSVGLMTKADMYRTGIEVGYWVAEPFWGRGLATEAVAAVATYAFETFVDVEAVQAHHLASNPASGRVLLKCGFQLEGQLRRAAVKAGVVSDVLVYSLTRADHLQRRAGVR